MRNTVIDRQLQHFRVDQHQPDLIRACLVQQADQHGVHPDRLTGTGGTGNQQVGHFGQIGNHRLTGDVVTECQGQCRFVVVIGFGCEHLAEVHHFPVFVGDFNADVGLAGNDLHDPHADHRQRARQILGQIADLADFYTRVGLDLKTGNHRPGIDRYHFRDNAKVRQL